MSKSFIQTCISRNTFLLHIHILENTAKARRRSDATVSNTANANEGWRARTDSDNGHVFLLRPGFLPTNATPDYVYLHTSTLPPYQTV